MSPYDLIVVGAGPAGSGTARTASKLGLKTLLLEKDKLPRDKLCRGGVTPKVLNLFDFKFPNELVERANGWLDYVPRRATKTDVALL